MPRQAIKTQGNFITYDKDGARRAGFALKSDQILFEAALELLEASKKFIANLEDADEDKDEEGKVFLDISGIKRIIARIEGRNR